MERKPDFIRLSEYRAKEIEEKFSSNSSITIDIIKSAINENERGDAFLLKKVLKDKFIYDAKRGFFFRFENGYWKKDIENEVLRYASDYFNAFYNEASEKIKKEMSGLPDDQQKPLAALYDQVSRRLSRINTRHRIESVVKMACDGKAESDSLSITGDEWNSDPYALQAEGKIIDLRSGSAREGIPTDYISKVCPTEWKGLETPCPAWRAFLCSVFKDDSEIVEYVQKTLGAALIGKVLLHEYYIFWGKGRNGKGVMLETLLAVLGTDICGPISADLIMDGKKGKSNNTGVEILDLQGKRIVWISETTDGQWANTESLKKLTGGDTLEGYYKFSNDKIIFTPTHTLFLLTNHKPRIPATDTATWDRTRLVNFPMRFVQNPQFENEAKQDIHLKEKLLAEKSGILAWLVEGCIKWQNEKDHIVPDSIIESGEEYRLEEDIVKQYIIECCITGEGYATRMSDLYNSFCKWYREQYGENAHTLSHVKFSKRLQEEFRRDASGRNVLFYGIGIVEDI